MTNPADPVDALTDSAQPAMLDKSLAHENPPSTPPPQEADEHRIHLYEAVSTQRDKVLGAFDTQRAAILKAVADQRAAALAPIAAVNVRRAPRPRATPATNPAMPRHGGSAASGNGTIGAGGRHRLMIEARRATAAQIVAALKTMVAAEVRAQLDATLRANQAPHDKTQHASGRP